MNHQPPAVSFFSFFIVLVTAALAAFALSYPLLGTLGPESGILFGVVLGPTLYLSGSIRGAYRDRRGFSQDLIHELLVGLIATTLFALALAINAFFTTSCAPERGILPFVVHVVPVLLFDCACGITLGRLVGRRWLALLVALAVGCAHLFLLSILWWQTPGFRFFSHAYLIIDGDLWNGAGFSTQVIAFKFVTIILSIAIIITGCVLFPSNDTTSFIRKAGLPRRTLFAALACFVVGAFAHYVVAERIQPSRSSLRNELSLQIRRGAFVVHSDPTRTTEQEVKAVLAEATLWKDRLKARLGSVLRKDIHIWLYADAETLSKYTGALNVHFALPKHREIHISTSVVPHPTLGHELAHVFVGEKTSTLLGVPGTFGLLANQGLTEGLAMMLTPELSIKNDLSLEEQAAALAQSGMLPQKEVLFSLSPFSFFSTNSSMAYSVAGAYLNQLVERSAKNGQKKAELIAKLARDGVIKESPFDDAIFASLKTQTLPKDAIPSVVALFASKPVLASTCDGRDLDIEKPDSDPLISARLFMLKAKSISEDHIQEKYVALEKAGDLFWRAGKHEEAADSWQRIDSRLLPPQKQRTLQAKLILSAVADSPLANDALTYLIDANAGPVSVGSTAAFASSFENLRMDDAERNRSAYIGLSKYLLLRAKILSTGSSQDLASMKTIASLETLPESFRTESMRLRAVALALGPNLSDARVALNELSQLNIRPALAIQIKDMDERTARIDAALALSQSNPKSADKWLLGINRFDQ